MSFVFEPTPDFEIRTDDTNLHTHTRMKVKTRNNPIDDIMHMLLV